MGFDLGFLALLLVCAAVGVLGGACLYDALEGDDDGTAPPGAVLA